MDETKDHINQLLHKTTTKKNSFALADLETSIVYLVAAAKAKIADVIGAY